MKADESRAVLAEGSRQRTSADGPDPPVAAPGSSLSPLLFRNPSMAGLWRGPLELREGEKVCRGGRSGERGRRQAWGRHLNPVPLCLPSPAILGMYTLMSNKQYYDAICSGEICNTEGISSECAGEACPPPAPRALRRQPAARRRLQA